MKLVILLLLSTSIFATNILTNYRLNGIKEIEKQMDSELSQVSYWSEFLKDKDTTFGYLESYSNVLTCNKKNSTLNLYSTDQNKKFKFRKEYSAFTGKKKGDKIKEGDLKTPIGIYNIVKKLSKETKLNSFYGPLAFVTSYPNLYDSYRGKDGSGIWIHGLPTEQKRDEFTRGCIAINNPNIECLDKNIDITKTLLIINSDKVKRDISKKTLASILSQLYTWRYSWLYNDIDTYLGFYAYEFIRSDGINFGTFRNYKTRVFKKIEKKSITFKNIDIIPYPNSENIFQITFKEFYTSSSFKFEGQKVLMVKLDKDNNFKIFTEK